MNLTYDYHLYEADQLLQKQPIGTLKNKAVIIGPPAINSYQKATISKANPKKVTLTMVDKSKLELDLTMLLIAGMMKTQHLDVKDGKLVFLKLD